MRLLLHTSAQSRGITIIEVIVSIAIIVMITGGMIAFEKSIFTNSKVLQSALISQQQIRKTLGSFTSELRSASPSSGGAYAIEIAATSTLVFYSNIDNDVAIERVRYFFATSSANNVYNVLKKGITKPTGTMYDLALEKISTVANDIKNSSTTPIFTYYDASYNGQASSTAPLVQPVFIPAIRLIKISLDVDPNAARSPFYQTYTTQVTLRNLKDNL